MDCESYLFGMLPRETLTNWDSYYMGVFTAVIEKLEPSGSA